MSEHPSFIVYGAPGNRYLVLRRNDRYDEYNYYAEAPDLFRANMVANAHREVCQ
jgi:hypothetical protein